MVVEGSGMMMESSGSSTLKIEDPVEESIQESSGDSFLISDDGLVILEDELESKIPLDDRAEEPQQPCSAVCQSNEIFYNGECLTVDLCTVLGVCDEDSTCQNNKDGPPTCLPFDPCTGNPCDLIKGAECVAKGASYSCLCEDGAKADNGSCERNPCSDLSCQSCESCYNFEAGPRCVKKSGFDHSSAKCADIDGNPPRVDLPQEITLREEPEEQTIINWRWNMRWHMETHLDAEVAQEHSPMERQSIIMTDAGRDFKKYSEAVAAHNLSDKQKECTWNQKTAGQQAAACAA